MEQAQQILEGLDEQQRRAATTLNGPVRIIAGAGAGKTRTYATHRLCLRDGSMEARAGAGRYVFGESRCRNACST